MNKLQIFNHPDFGNVELIDDNGKLLFGASQVASVLGYSNPRKAIIDHCRAEGVTKRDTLTDGGQQEMNFIDEGNLYRLIVKSKLPLAVKFETWVFDEVLPQIRKTGTYGNQIPKSYSEALRLAANLSEENEKLQIESQINAPKVALYEVAISAKNNLTMNAVAKSLGYGRNKLFDFLREQKVLMKNNLPYETYVQRGYFDVRQYTITHFTQDLENKSQTLVTPKGMAWIHDLLVKNGRVSA